MRNNRNNTITEKKSKTTKKNTKLVGKIKIKNNKTVKKLVKKSKITKLIKKHIAALVPSSSQPTPIPHFIDYEKVTNENGETKIVTRPIIIIPIPRKNTWFCPNILFYRSSATSNIGKNLESTENTWLPLVDVVSEENIAFYQSFNTKTKDDISPGYFLKMKFLTEVILSKSNLHTHAIIYPYSLVKLFEDYLKTELQKKYSVLVFLDSDMQIDLESNKNKYEYHFDIDRKILINSMSKTELKEMADFIGEIKEMTIPLWQIINLYFYSPWQIHYSVLNDGKGDDDKESELWKKYPSFVEFIKTYLKDSIPKSHHIPSSLFSSSQSQTQTISQFLKDVSVKYEKFDEFIESQKNEMVIFRGYFLDNIGKSIRTASAMAKN
jgi:hypothetical protein